MTVKVRIIEYRILCLLLIYMPFHLYICELLIKKTNIDNILRDVLILFLFILSLKKKRYTRQSFIVGVGIATIAAYAILSYLIYSYPGTFNIARTYIVPILIFYAVSKMDFSLNEIKSIHHIICIESALIALYGFFQAFF